MHMETVNRVVLSLVQYQIEVVAARRVQEEPIEHEATSPPNILPEQDTEGYSSSCGYAVCTLPYRHCFHCWNSSLST